MGVVCYNYPQNISNYLVGLLQDETQAHPPPRYYNIKFETNKILKNMFNILQYFKAN